MASIYHQRLLGLLTGVSFVPRVHHGKSHNACKVVVIVAYDIRIDVMWVHKDNAYFAKLKLSDTLAYGMPHPRTPIKYEFVSVYFSIKAKYSFDFSNQISIFNFASIEKYINMINISINFQTLTKSIIAFFYFEDKKIKI